jgi:plastocyanin
MTWLSRTVFSLLLAATGFAADVRGSVQLAHVHAAASHGAPDYSGLVVWLTPTAAAPTLTPQPGRATMTQKDKRFIPHVLAVRVGTTVRFPNLDPIFHSAFSNFSGQVFELGLYPPGTSRDVTFSRPGVDRIFCNIHPAMSAVIVVLEHPWFAVSDSSGAFVIHNVPPGAYTLHVFHERATKETLSALESRREIAGDMTLAPLIVSEVGYIDVPHKNKYGADYPHPADGAGGYSMEHK